MHLHLWMQGNQLRAYEVHLMWGLLFLAGLGYLFWRIDRPSKRKKKE